MADSDMYVETSLKGFNEVVGGFPIGSIVALAGPPEGGKSILGVQLGSDVAARRGGNMAVVDTEGGMHTQKEWVQKLNEARGTDYTVEKVEVVREKIGGRMGFDLKYEKPKSGNKVYVVDCRAVVKLLGIHGRGMELGVSEKGGKMSLKPIAGQWILDVLDTPMGKFVSDCKIKYLAYDSFTNPMKEFGSNQENFPVRANATSLMMLQAQLLTTEMDLCTMIMLHHSMNPTSPYARPSAHGGSALAYNIKYSLYLLQHTQNDGHTPTPAVKGKNKTDRYLWVTRHPSRQAWEQSATFTIGRKGFEDAEE